MNENENYDDDQHLQIQPNSKFADWCAKTDSECKHLNFSAWECECGPGWIPILDILFSYADEWNATVPENGNDQIQIEQVKEKFGGLRFYYTGGSPEFRGMVEMAEMLSYNICEWCGDAAKPPNKGYWNKPMCRRCTESRKDKN